MRLSRLESEKLLVVWASQLGCFGIDWDGLGCFRPHDGPVLVVRPEGSFIPTKESPNSNLRRAFRARSVV
jgi:hypothetical protein